MAAETMPERIWAVRGGRGTGSWYLSNGFERIDTQYIRADLCVLASHHQRVIEALREAEKALAPFAEAGGTPMFGNEEDVPLHFKGKHFRRARVALAIIKETAP